MKRILILSAVAGALAFGQSAKANSVSYNLDTGNSAISSYINPGGSYGNVLVNLTDSTHATITFTAGNSIVSGDTFVFLFAANGMADVNVNAGTFGTTVTTPSSYKSLTSGNDSGFGTFNLEINGNSGGPSDRVSSVVFTLHDTSGTWADAADVLTANSSGYSVAAHIFVIAANGSVANTGYAANGGTFTRVPDGGTTATLLGMAMLGMGWVRRTMLRK